MTAAFSPAVGAFVCPASAIKARYGGKTGGIAALLKRRQQGAAYTMLKMTSARCGEEDEVNDDIEIDGYETPGTYCSQGLNTGTRALSKSLRSRVTTVNPW
jgi:hypothetical protein